MSPSLEQLLYRFYAGDTDVLDELAWRYDPMLAQIAYQVLFVRTGSPAQSMGEWEVNDRLDEVWAVVLMSRQVNAGRWPHQRISALTWLIHLLCQEMDRHLGLRPPF